MRKLKICLMLAIVLVFSSALAASVTYEGGAEDFVFLPGSAYSDTDLFEGFKGVLPGDTIRQTIRVQNDSGAPVRIYLRADPVNPEDADFLNQLRLTVTAGSKEIFDAAAGVQDGLAENTLLGSFRQGGGTSLTVNLEVPNELGNEYMGRIGTVPWIFLTEEIAADESPETGDWFRPALWCGAAALLLGCIALLLMWRWRMERS